jgi:uncharacterized protein with FMN-binding domain
MRRYIQITFFSLLFIALLIYVRSVRGTGNGGVPVLSEKKTTQQSNTSKTSTNNSSQNTSTSTPTSSNPTYKNGTFTGQVENVYYGNVQVQVTISSGSISNINVLQYPNDNPTSNYISTQAISMLKSEVIQAQSSNVNMISGASYVSSGFIQSLQTALSQAS